ncbi:MAG: hypothetical protein RLZZ490_382 [Cyanobacteriota bacterium]
MTTAYLLVAHGSRDPRPQIALERLAYLVGQNLAVLKAPCLPSRGTLARVRAGYDYPHLGNGVAVLTKPALPVLGANLECQSLPLHGQIIQLIQPLMDEGITDVKIMPLFLSPGVHVCEDLPAEIHQAQERLGSRCRLIVFPYLGSLPPMVPWLEQYFQQTPSQTPSQRVLLAHGSRRPGGNMAIADLAQQLNAQVAFWKTEPSLEVVLSQIRCGESVVVLPYFLFAGGLTDLLQRKHPQWQRDYPGLNLNFGEPLGPNPALARLIAEVFHRG